MKKGDRLLGVYDVEAGPISGGMGDVFLVHHIGWRVKMAMKRPHDHLFVTESQKAFFIRECETWIGLGGLPHIVNCYFVRELSGTPSIFSEWMSGGSLADWIRDGRLHEGTDECIATRILDIAIQFARGLRCAHEKGIVHQDVKPANLLLTGNGYAGVADFGIAQILSSSQPDNSPAGITVSSGEAALKTAFAPGSGAYTPAYCAPEQPAGESVTKRTDVYSWAVCVLEMYLGERLWPSGPVAGIAFEEYVSSASLSMPDSVAALLSRCLAEQPSERPRDFAELEPELLRIYEEEVGTSYPRRINEKTDLPAFLNNRALSLLELGNPEAALDCWMQALEIDPWHEDNMINLETFRLKQKAEKTDDEYLKRAAERIKYRFSRIWQDE